MGAVVGTQRDTNTFRDHLRRTMEETFTELSAVNSGIRTLMSRVPPDSPGMCCTLSSPVLASPPHYGARAARVQTTRSWPS